MTGAERLILLYVQDQIEEEVDKDRSFAIQLLQDTLRDTRYDGVPLTSEGAAEKTEKEDEQAHDINDVDMRIRTTAFMDNIAYQPMNYRLVLH